MAESLSLTVVAEGVETKNQLEFLKNEKRIKIQGYFLSKPLSVDEFEIFMKNYDIKKLTGGKDVLK